MTQDMVSPWSFYKGWDVYQSHLVKAIEPLAPEQLELRISPLRLKRRGMAKNSLKKPGV